MHPYSVRFARSLAASARAATPTVLFSCVALLACDDSTSSGAGDDAAEVPAVEPTTPEPNEHGDAGASAPLGTAPTDGGATGQDTPPVPFVTSGERLKAQYWAGAGGRAFRTLFDLNLDSPCTFLRMEGDSEGLRCVPGAQLPILYKDARCTNSVFARTDPCHPTTGQYVYEATTPECAGALPTARAYRLLGSTAAPNLYALQGGTCVEVEPDTILVHELVEVLPTQLVAAESVTLPAGEGLSVLQAHADDGTQITLQPQTDDGTFCSIRDGRCLPEPVALWSASFADEACSQATAITPARRCGVPQVAVRPLPSEDAESCAQEEDVYPVVPDPLMARYSADAGACSEDTRPAEGAVFPLSETPISAELPRVALAELPANGALRARSWQTTEGITLTASRELFSAQGEVCQVHSFEDGIERCLPHVFQTGAAVAGYSDDVCSLPLYALPTACGAAPRAVVAELTANELEPCPSKVSELLEALPFDGDVFIQDGEGCVLLEPNPELTYYTPGAPLAGSAFEAVTIELDE